jgi:uncharacterized protein YcsI (UPF0317 family)
MAIGLVASMVLISRAKEPLRMQLAQKMPAGSPALSFATGPSEVRQLCRAGAYDGPTSGLAAGYVQANLAILPADLADAFLLFCQRNPKPCPLIGMGEVGEPFIRGLGADLDLSGWWRDDLVAFALGCSHSFEEALLEDGLEIRHIARAATVPMYRTNIPCAPAGPFAGPLVVSMRSFKAADAIRAVQITTRFPAVHGAPVHLGRPDLIGIADIAKPDWGDAMPVPDDEVPLFWACGVTPQAVIAAAKPAFAITHAPGRMLVTDTRNSRLSIL